MLKLKYSTPQLNIFHISHLDFVSAALLFKLHKAWPNPHHAQGLANGKLDIPQLVELFVDDW